MRAITCLSTAIILLAGCASAPPQPKPVMGESMYSFFGEGWVLVNKCSASGRMPANTATFGRIHMQEWAGTFTVDMSRMNTVVASYFTQEPTDQQCSNATAVVEGWRQQRIQAINNNNAFVASQQQQWVNQLNSSKTNQVYCNSIGTQIICNKY